MTIYYFYELATIPITTDPRKIRIQIKYVVL